LLVGLAVRPVDPDFVLALSQEHSARYRPSMMWTLAIIFGSLATLDLPQVPAGAEAVSLLGKPLQRPALEEERRTRVEEDLRQAREMYEKNPGSVDAAVWVGRQIAYLGRFREAIDWYTTAMERHGPHAKLLRHRGHRYLTVRELDRAVQDFEAAARLLEGTPDEIEPDGVPNELNQPISSLHSNVWYHLALAHYLKGDFASALKASTEGMKLSANPDRLVSQSYWHYLSLRRLGRHEEARRLLEPVHAEMELLENHAYLRLLLVFKGALPADEVQARATAGNDGPTTAYGLGAFLLVEGREEEAKVLFEEAISGPAWPAFGYLAAEAELARPGRVASPADPEERKGEGHWRM
jgi:tetratricopeptide (TPR) repeat protein